MNYAALRAASFDEPWRVPLNYNPTLHAYAQDT